MKKHGFHIWIASGVTLIAALHQSGLAGNLEEIKNLTEARTRIVWVQDSVNFNDTQAEGKKLHLIGLDTADAMGEHPILAQTSNYYRPLITPKGDRVIFSNQIDCKVFVINWDGSGLREIANGIAEAVWQNPENGMEWVYVRNGRDKKTGRHKSGSSVDRYQINQPLIEEPVWRNEKFPMEDINLSADGKKATGTFPWPVIGVADLATGEFTRCATGCWPSISPDNSYRMWSFEGSHKAVKMFSPDMKNSWIVPINETAETLGKEVYHPQWTNHPRFMCMTGPYGKISKGGKNVSIYLGKFDAEYKKIERWVKVTHNQTGDFFPNVWIDPADRIEAPAIPRAIASAPAVKAVVPAQTSSRKTPLLPHDPGLIFSWENGITPGLVIDPETDETKTAAVKPRGLVFFDRYREMNFISDGSFVATDADDALLSGAMKTGQLTIEAVIYPYRKNLPGPAHIITFSSTPKSRNFCLSQDEEYLTLCIRTTHASLSEMKQGIRLCKLTRDVPNHVVVTFQSRRLLCYLNGKQVYDASSPKGDFSNWVKQHLVFGDDWKQGGADWSGKLEGVAIFNRVLTAENAAQHWAAFQEKLKNRKPPEQVKVTARLLSVTQSPTLESIAPYTSALIVNEYEIEQVTEGSLADKKIQVCQWGLLNSQYAKINSKIGSSYRLTLEKFSDQPQLEGQRLVSDSDNFGMPLFYAVETKRLIDRRRLK